MFCLKRLDFSGDSPPEFFFRNNQLILGHTDRLGHTFQRQFHIHVVFLGTEDDANGGILAFATLQTVKQRQLIVHLSGIFGDELAYFQVDGDKATQPPVEEEHINATLLAIVLQHMLIAYERETLAKFQKKELNFSRQDGSPTPVPRLAR